jgi:hypothetical protein
MDLYQQLFSIDLHVNVKHEDSNGAKPSKTSDVHRWPTQATIVDGPSDIELEAEFGTDANDAREVSSDQITKGRAFG